MYLKYLMPGLPFGELRETKKFLMLKKGKPEILRYAKVSNLIPVSDTPV